MPKTEEQKRDGYYRRKYGVGLDWYNVRFAEQGGCCGICRRPQEQFSKRFAVDHDHGWKRATIEVWNDAIWYAAANYLDDRMLATALTKNEAKRKLRKGLLARSCRGLLCPFCNRGLRFYADDPTRLANAAEYLKRHQNA